MGLIAARGPEEKSGQGVSQVKGHEADGGREQGHHEVGHEKLPRES